MCADFVAPQFQNPDFLAAALKGQALGQNAAAFPGQMALQGQQVQSGQLNLDQLRQMMQIRQQAFQSYQRTMDSLNQPGAQNPQTAGNAVDLQSAAQPGGGDGGIQNGPQGDVSGTASNDPLAWALDPRRINANMAMSSLNATLSGGDANKPIADAVKLQDEIRQRAVANGKLAQDLPTPGNVMPMLKSIAQLDPEAAAAALDNNNALHQNWPAIAKAYGKDPWDKRNVPIVAALEYNRKGAPYGNSVPVPEQVDNLNLPGGEIAQIDRKTGKKIGDLKAYDPGLAAAGQITPDALEQAYQVSKQSGDLTQSLAGRDPWAAANVSAFIAKRAKEEGITGLQMAAQKQAHASSQLVLNDFLDPNGKAGSKLTAINTLTGHADEAISLIDAMKTGDIQKINAAKIAYQKATGNPAPTNYETMAHLYAGEFGSAILQAGGTEGERDALLAPFQGANSPAQIRGAILTSARAMAGKTKALENQWNVGTQGQQGPFNKLLLPETRKFLGQESAHPPKIQSLLDKYK